MPALLPASPVRAHSRQHLSGQFDCLQHQHAYDGLRVQCLHPATRAMTASKPCTVCCTWPGTCRPVPFSAKTASAAGKKGSRCSTVDVLAPDTMTNAAPILVSSAHLTMLALEIMPCSRLQVNLWQGSVWKVSIC
eukprot:GHRR01022133.1.p1 GENE.GHRR01022133.1~~GHRR01022133.1.p1  ORF type:complete len:149 (+),score=27.80 GHRR01022133.1:45-449(+)